MAGAIEEYGDVDPARFHGEILPAARPAVLRGLVADWPVVREGRASPEALVQYMARFDRGKPMGAMIGPPRINGRFFYNEDLSSFNFRKEQVKLSGALDFMLSSAEDEKPAGIAVQSVPVRENLPGFEEENGLPLLDGVEPRVWIGNAVTIAAHHDPSENIACVAAGRRRFTLFPPDQVANLYPGPFELTPAGATISMVDFDAPDFELYPRFREALDASLTAELEPGDAIFIPYLWWHHVRSVEKVNMLVNYWWTPPPEGRGRPYDALFHAMLAIKDMSPAHRDAWRAMFEYYVFQADGTPGAHLSPDRRGVMGELGEAAARNLRASLMRTLGGS